LILFIILLNTLRAPHPRKLTQAKEFQSALKAPCRISSDAFVLRAAQNGLPGARLGLIASRKAARRAVDRNRAKRLAREVFRGERLQLPALDLVVQLKHDLRSSGNVSVRAELVRLMRQAGSRFSGTGASNAQSAAFGKSLSA
jgi:ribonuclease P protein component